MKNSEKKTEYFDIGASPPKPEQKPTCRQIHGETLVDDYGWLAAANWREALQDPNLLPKNIKDLIESENDYCEQVVKPLALLRKTLITEMRARIKETDGDVPDFDGCYEYYEKFQEGAEYLLYCRRPRGGWEETILLDIETRAQNKDFFDVGEISHSPDHTQLAWSVDENGCEMFKIYSKKISDDYDRADVVSNTDGDIVWNTSAQAFYYVVMDENHRPSQVWHHTIGSNPTTDKLILEELDNAWS
ncbi:MAG: S9 family peptidase, partial [Methylocystis sp.]